MSAPTSIRTAIATLAVFAGALAFSSAPALAAAPSVLSESAPSPRAEEARLEATVNPHNESTECHFQYGTASVSENQVECEQGNALEGEEQGVAVNVSGLSQNTTYQYRVVLKSAGGVAEGPTESFTSAVRPEAPVTLAAELITGTTATLTGELNPGVTATNGYFFAYDNNGTCEPAFTTPPGPETTETKRVVSTPVTGLVGGTEYTFCVLATNSAGEATAGSAVSFKTPAAKPAVEAGSERVGVPGSRSVTFEANVNPENQETSVVFEYAITEAALLKGEGVKVPAAAGLPATGENQAVSELAEGLQPAQGYFFRVTATNATGTTHTTPIAFATPAVPLVEETQPEASEVTQNTALIGHITIDPEMEEPLEEPREEPTYYILYGTTEAYGQALPAPVHAGAGYGLTGREVPPVALSGLTPGTTYHYAVVAHNQNGTETSHDHQFTTVAAEPLTTAPAVGSSSAQFVNEDSAVIEGEINPEGLPASFEVQYATSSAYGVGSPTGQVTPFATMQGTITALTGLQPNTTYHYRLVASSQAGTSYGPDETFTTTGATQTGAFTPFDVPTTPQITIAPFNFPREETRNPLTNKQKLAAALKACAKKHNKAKRATCKRQAHKRYGAKTALRHGDHLPARRVTHGVRHRPS
jgi:phosphodiesterase/alkaline phosphatase D-like protein